MKRLITYIGAVCLLAAALTAHAQSKLEEPGIGTAVAAFEMEYTKRSADDVLKRTQFLAQLMTGKQLAFNDSARTLAQPVDAAWLTPFADAPQLLVRYLPQVDEFRLLDSETTKDFASPAVIDEPGALKVAKNVLEQLGRARLIDLRHYDIARAQIGYHKALTGSHKSGKPESERVTEYRITLRPAINGIEVATGGLRLGVHVSGKLVGLRLGGATVKTLPQGASDAPAGNGKYLTRRIANESLDKRFADSAAKLAARQVHWSRLMYAMPEGATNAVVEPVRIYAYTDAYLVDDQRMPSRRKLVGYSITDAAAAAIDFTAPTKPVEEKQRLQ